MSNLAVLILSCDKYSDLWNPFFTFFFKHWGNCKFPVYFCSDTKKYGSDKINSISPGMAMEWSARLHWALSQIREKYVLLILDDYFLIRDVDEKRILRYLEIIEKQEAAYLRIYPLPGPDKLLKGYSDIGIINPGSPYRTSTQASIWNRKELLNFIDPSECIWDFEIIGSRRSNLLEKKFLCIVPEKEKRMEKANYAFNYYCTAVYKGKWMKEAVKLCHAENLVLDLNYRKVESRWDEFRRVAYPKSPVFIRHILDFINKRVNGL